MTRTVYEREIGLGDMSLQHVEATSNSLSTGRVTSCATGRSDKSLCVVQKSVKI